MRHQRVVKKFGRSTAHRAMLMKSLVTNLILAESIKTTLPKAKEARKDADKIVTIAKKGDLAARRLASSRLLDPAAVQKLFAKVAPAMKDRKGGYSSAPARAMLPKCAYFSGPMSARPFRLPPLKSRRRR